VAVLGLVWYRMGKLMMLAKAWEGEREEEVGTAGLRVEGWGRGCEGATGEEVLRGG
jgi:hypothetical protein